MTALVAAADNRKVWRNLIHTFPHPYTEADARAWIRRCREQSPSRDVVVEVNGEFAGVCGIQVGEGVSAYTGSVGYWLGERYWNRGIASRAFGLFLEYVWSTFDVERLQAEVFAWNPASARVLEKNGFLLEGTRRRAIHKDGEFVDEWFYSLLRGDLV